VNDKMNKKTKDAIIKRLKPSMIYAVCHNENRDFVRGYNTMLEKAIKVIEKYPK